MTKPRVKNPDESNRTRWDLYLWSCYRLTVEEYDALTKNGCHICGSFERLCVDHDHNCCTRINSTTGKRTNKTCGKCIRGVLCRRHNLALGNLQDSIEETKALLNYLET